jgi:hypothetical protein
MSKLIHVKNQLLVVGQSYFSIKNWPLAIIELWRWEMSLKGVEVRK